MHRLPTILALLLFAIGLAQPAASQEKAAFRGLEPLVLPAVDAEQIILADERRAEAGRVPHYATPIEVAIDPFGEDVGKWEVLPGETARWRLRLVSPGALSLNLAFTRFRMPPGGRLELISADGRRVGPWTALDNEEHGQLWTPPIPTDDLVLELRLPIDEVDGLELELTRVHHGYAGFGEAGPRSGACHRGVACSEAEPWADQARSVALLSVAGRSFCTGFLVNNTALDGRPFLITASHCGVTPRNAASVVVMWNHQREDCAGDKAGSETAPHERGWNVAAEGHEWNVAAEGREWEVAPEGREWNDFQTGAIWRASHRPSDTLLLELDDSPSQFGVYYAGWDRSPAAPARSTVIHHPNTDVKRISFDFDRATTTAHLDAESAPAGDHLRIGEWDMGSTEGGSSGAPLFNSDKRIVGQLHGGYAACGEPRSDWFGRFSTAWSGLGRPGARLSDWLDPLATGTATLDGLDSVAIESPSQ